MGRVAVVGGSGWVCRKVQVTWVRWWGVVLPKMLGNPNAHGVEEGVTGSRQHQ